MKKKEIVFTIGLCIFMGVLWIIGELIMGLWIPVLPKTHLYWLIGIVAFTLIVNIWHGMKEDTSEPETPHNRKYDRKVNGRKQKKLKKKNK
ncbi:MAG: hypothetical protein J6I47_00115 [Ruminococcus sp.]|nr:hypothetical protein [Ruminococcus sp.]MBQ1340583.1 hypothetical protein [Ruminococcus sp.]